jgi:hypothetical protein
MRGKRVSLVQTYRDQDGKVRHRHLWSLTSPEYSRRSFTMNLLFARKFYNLPDEEWFKILDKARPYLDDDEDFQRLLHGPLCEYQYEPGGPLTWYSPRFTWQMDWAWDL